MSEHEFLTETTPLTRDAIRAKLVNMTGCPQHLGAQFMSIRPDGTVFCPTCGRNISLDATDTTDTEVSDG